jgi:hypothetical protein
MFQINVIDSLTDGTMLKSTSIVCLVSFYMVTFLLTFAPLQHWHGFFQKGTNWADGPAFVNQCPIAPGKLSRALNLCRLAYLFELHQVLRSHTTSLPPIKRELSGITAISPPSTVMGCEVRWWSMTRATRTPPCTISIMVNSQFNLIFPV